MRFRLPLLVLAVVGSVLAAAGAVIPEQVPDLPVLGPETPRGHITSKAEAAIAPATKTVDGDISDWIGTPTRLGGTAIYSAGEYVYQDYLTDDHGADDGRDRERLDTLDPLKDLEPRTYRLDPFAQVLGDEFGVDGPPLVSGKPAYGDAELPGPLSHEGDIVEARVAADAANMFFLVRTNGMTVTPGTAVLILLDTEEGGSYAAPGSITTVAEWAFLVAGNQVLASTFKGAAVACGASCSVATNATGFVNAVEIGIARSLLDPIPTTLKLGVATGVVNETGTGLADISTGDATADLVNVAFRFEEPVRIRMDREQALALLAGSIDPFLASVDLGKLAGGATESFAPGPGYYDRIYVSHSPIATETHSSGEYQGIFQHYGLYIPTSYDPTKLNPAVVWLHPRSSGNAHLAGAWVPGIIRQLGERRGTLGQGNVIISPSARGSSTWWVGRGHEDFRESWDDAMASYSIDPDRVYVAGHSMGGFGSYLVGLLYPDRFAAAFPISGPTQPGGWTGVGDPIASQDDNDVETEFMFNILENARNLPYVIYQGTNDELVFWPGIARTAARFTQLGYRHRFYSFPGQEHYSPLIVDEYADARRYMDTFRRDPNPAHVTYKVWPALEHAVESVRVPAGALDYTFDGAYWVDGLTVRSGSASDPTTMGTFDAITEGHGVPTILTLPDAGVASVGQTSPYVMTGLQWLQILDGVPANAFTVTLTNIATAELDLARMGLLTNIPLKVATTTDGPATLELKGTWATTPTVSGAVSSSYAAGVLTLTIGASTTQVTITP
jgi:pimeloyl-ACP methyl ester carboxylesterase